MITGRVRCPQRRIQYSEQDSEFQRTLFQDASAALDDDAFLPFASKYFTLIALNIVRALPPETPTIAVHNA